MGKLISLGANRERVDCYLVRRSQLPRTRIRLGGRKPSLAHAYRLSMRAALDPTKYYLMRLLRSIGHRKSTDRTNDAVRLPD